MRISIIISTYNSPDYLEKVIWGYSKQTYHDFELIVADDGSGNETKDKINELREKTNLDIVHVWHCRNGFQKNRILNKAIEASNFDYLVFTDGDCIPRSDFVEQHIKKMQYGYFLSGGAFRLSKSLSKTINRDDIYKQNCFKIKWLHENGLKYSVKMLKLFPDSLLPRFLNYISLTNISWNGGNASCWKKDLLKVNGYDERLKYGGEDRELGERLINSGLKGKQIRYTAVAVHLDHSRPYVERYQVERNRKVRHKTKKSGRFRTSYGIKKERNCVYVNNNRYP